MGKEFKIHILKAHKELLEAIRSPLGFALKRLEQRIKELEKSVAEEMKVEEKPRKSLKARGNWEGGNRPERKRLELSG